MENNFGEFLKKNRQEKNLTQLELSKLLYVSESAVSKWEKNVAHPDITLLPKLAQVLGVTEHELITASIDNELAKEKIQAKNWKRLSFSWNMFFYISYAITILTCFIVNLAINKTLDWFWIVLSSLVLASTFTTIPQFIKTSRLIFIPLLQFIALAILLLTSQIYCGGNWFFVSIFSVLFGLSIIFIPIYISKYKIFEKIKNYNDFISIAIDFILLNILLIIINSYAIQNCLTNSWWYFTIALPVVCIIYLILNLFLCVRFLKVNGLLKTSIIMIFINILFLLPSFIKVNNTYLQKEIDDANIFKANFTSWIPEAGLDNNVALIIFLTILFLAINFFVFGLIKYINNKKHKK